MNAVTHMLPYDMQLSNEYKYSRKFIDKYIRQELEADPVALEKVQQGVHLLQDWLGGNYYESKQKRLAFVQRLNLEELVKDIFVGLAYVQTPELFTSVSAQLAGRLGFSDKEDGIQTMGEILAVLCETDVFDIHKAGQHASLLITSNIQLSERLMEYIAQSQYLPPMVCPPREIRTNRQSGYLTHNDSVILKHYNHHDGDVCLDVINTQNQIPLSLNVEFLKTMEELPPSDLNEVEGSEMMSPYQVKEIIEEKRRQWEKFKEQSRHVYALMVGQGNRFWLTHKVDKRGRLYAQGYHINYQGTKYKKAMVELADKEVVTGVPT